MAKPELIVEQEKFQNWAHTVTVDNVKTVQPTLINDIQQLQDLMKKHSDKRFRVVQYGHTWQNFFCEEDDYLICFRKFNDPLNTWELSWNNFYGTSKKDGSIGEYKGFWGITKVGSPYTGSDGQRHQLIKIGSAASTNDLRAWSMQQWEKSKTNKECEAWSIPAQVVMIQNSIGGTVNMMCHGSGVRHKSIADQVVAAEFINANGDLQRLCDLHIIKLANLEQNWKDLKHPMADKSTLKDVIGNFGLMGIVTFYYLEMDELKYAEYQPVAEEAEKAVPNTDSDQKFKNTFQEAILDAHYNEYFMYPGLPDFNKTHKKKCLANNWNTTTDPKKASQAVAMIKDFPTAAKQLGEQALTAFFFPYMKDIIDSIDRSNTKSGTNMRELFNHMVGRLALKFLETPAKIVPDCDALHPARGIQLNRMFDMEVEIPIPKICKDKDEKPEYDWDVVYKAWWEAEKIVYHPTGKDGFGNLPIVMEMRIYNGSEVLMCPAYGNDLTLAIEILSFRELVGEGDDMDEKLMDEWNAMMQEVFTAWSSITGTNGQSIKIVPHWAKQWDTLNYQEKGGRTEPIMTYIKDHYKERIPKFKASLDKVAKAGGYTFDDMVKRFGNKMIKNILSLDEHKKQ